MKITAWEYFVSITEVISSCQQVGNGAFFIVSNYVFRLLLGNQCVYVFDLHGKDKNGSISAGSTAVLLKFESLSLLKNCLISEHYT